MDFGDKANTQQLGKRARIDRVCFYFGVGDGFEHLRVGQGQGDPVARAPVGHPVPITGAFNYRVDRLVKLLEKKGQVRRTSGPFFLSNQLSVVIDSDKPHSAM
jgi:hypothetical protein